MKLMNTLSDYSLLTRHLYDFLVILLWFATIKRLQITLYLDYATQYDEIRKTVTLSNSMNNRQTQMLKDKIREAAYGILLYENGTHSDHLKVER
ncbi:hypothetical protein [Metabacillus malikii]|uniref:hypothetical protein n=1 Tax=Metabacillus malikii TaxID=1504265 RepID=UPI0027D8D507|nr:hypothetical protein [Metabacillus malikii]